MLYLHFIVNPISGDGKHIITDTILRKQFRDDEFTLKVEYTLYKEHAIELTPKSNPDGRLP